MMGQYDFMDLPKILREKIFPTIYVTEPGRSIEAKGI